MAGTTLSAFHEFNNLRRLGGFAFSVKFLPFPMLKIKSDFVGDRGISSLTFRGFTPLNPTSDISFMVRIDLLFNVAFSRKVFASIKKKDLRDERNATRPHNLMCVSTVMILIVNNS